MNRRLKLACVGIAVLAAAAAVSAPAYADADPALSFSINLSGGVSVNTDVVPGTTPFGVITSATTIKTFASDAGTVQDFSNNGPDVGFTNGSTVTFGVTDFYTVDGPATPDSEMDTASGSFTLTVGDLIFTFDDVSSATIVPTAAGTPGSISEQFNGFVTGDTSTGTEFSGQTASLSESCTQTVTTAGPSCSEDVATPGLGVPEPASVALYGTALLGLFGFGRVRRRHMTVD
ncbi:MAG TPA: PEP-CTERM sorting domain-containing protein [Stellaceae bacterium]|nr:PEP-CTERM sorting domain-containing protein [Stellaceae bacterium]